MSAGPSPLGTLLVQRLDAALGTTLSAQANVVSGARPDAVSQPGHPERPDALRNEVLRHPREVVDRAASQAEQHGRQAVDRARLDARTAAALLTRNAPNTTATPSAPTTLGQAAKAILALLANYPEQSAAVLGKRPLLNQLANALSHSRSSAGQPAVPGNAQTTASQAGARPAAAGHTAMAGAGGGAAAHALAAGQAGAQPAGVGSAAPHTTAGPLVMQLSQALTQALQTSGMFYESHLNQLAFGERSAAALRHEPQAHVPAGRQAPSQAGGGAESPASSSAATRSADASSSPSGPQPSGSSAAAASTATPSPASALAGLDPQTHVLVRQQLEVLANQTFAWRGEAWPEAPMEWEVSRHPASQDADAGEQTEHWATRIRVTLPALGEVQARLTLSGQQLVMHLAAPESVDVLNQHAETLRGRYAAQGLQLSQLSIAAASTEAEAAEHDADSHANADPDEADIP